MSERSAGGLHNDAMLSETIAEKEQVQQDLCKTENNLVNAYKRIEKLKQAVDVYKKNEETITFSVKDYEAKLIKSEEKYKRLKQDASAKMDLANEEIAKVRKQKEIDFAGIEASLRKAEHRIVSLEKDVTRKTEECLELSQICDELIKKVSVTQ